MKKLLFLLMIIGFYACSEDLTDNVLPNQDKAANKQEIMTRSAMLANESVEPTVKLGNKLENPYSVRNMKAAVRALKATGNIEIEVPESSIHPTHLYIEFSPESKEQLDILKADTTIEFYSYPLDYELIGTGVFDTAGALEDTQVESLYASWPYGKTLPSNVPYSILEELYIPDENLDDEPIDRKGMVSSNFIEALVDKSLELTGNIDTEPETRASRYYPQGYIKAWDDIAQDYVPIGGVKVRARRWFTTRVGYTDRNGHYLCRGDGFERPANYSICWESNYWDIRDGSIVQAFYNGPKQRGYWNLNIGGGKSLRYATLTRALYHHFFGPYLFDKILTLRKIKICYRHKKGDERGHFKTQALRGIQPDIVIYGEDAGGWRPTYGILETAFHELGHCAFFYRVNGRNAYKGYVDTIRESWSNLIGWAVTENEYTLRGYAHEVHKYETFFQPPMYHMLFEVPDEYNFQSWSKYSINTDYGREYTPIFIDIYDGSNQRVYYQKYRPNTDAMIYVNDNIYLNDIDKLQQVLYKSKTIPQLKEALKEYKGQYGITDKSLDDLFEFYL